MTVSAVKFSKADELHFQPGISPLKGEAVRPHGTTASWSHEDGGVEASLDLDPPLKRGIVGRGGGTVPVLLAEGVEPGQHPFQVEFVLLVVDLVDRTF